jgi:peptidoglycan/xylan/chitin deacetylase (PgdA/CDA1 family)
MIKEMSAAGMDIEPHARDHIDMRNRPDTLLFFQIVGARQAIEAHTGKPAPFYAYPAGRYDANLLRFLTERDFWMSVTTQPGRIHTLDSALTLPRVRIRGTDSLAVFISKMTSGR